MALKINYPSSVGDKSVLALADKTSCGPLTLCAHQRSPAVTTTLTERRGQLRTSSDGSLGSTSLLMPS